MLASIMYKLTAQNSVSIPAFHGRKLHAVFFSIVDNFSEEMAEALHDTRQFKPFTLSQLQPIPRGNNTHGFRITKSRGREFYQIRQGDEFYWRINLLVEDLIQAVIEVPLGTEFQLDRLSLKLDKIICDGSHDTGVLEIEELMAGAFSANHVSKVEFNFTSPVAFRSFDDDYAFPTPELIFGSLADKWNSIGMPVTFDKDSVKETAALLLPQEWEGKSEKVYFAADRGALSFRGKFNFSMKRLADEEREAVIMLASLAPFAGVGRLTGQGFGQTRINFS